MKKLVWIFNAVLLSIISISYINQIVKWLTAYLLLGSSCSVKFNGLTLLIHINQQSSISIERYVLVVISPLLASILFIELVLIIFPKLKNIALKNALIVYLMINIGYLIFSVILPMMSIIFKSNYSGDWFIILSSHQFSYQVKILSMLLILILLIGYINVVTKRIKKFISVFGLPKK